LNQFSKGKNHKKETIMKSKTLAGLGIAALLAQSSVGFAQSLFFEFQF